MIVGEGLEAIDFGKLISLNDSAAWLWAQAQELDDFSVENLAESLCQHYEVGIEQAKADVSNIVAEWTNEGLVEA